MKTFIATALVAFSLLLPVAQAATLEPFVATYEAWYDGRRAGTATLRVAREEAPYWSIDMDVRADRGVAGIVRLNLHQHTRFDVHGQLYRPLQQETRRRTLLFGRTARGEYDWHARTARWSGNISEHRTQPVPLEDGDLSALLVNLAVVRDAEPGRHLEYRLVDNGRARRHVYQVADEPEIVKVDDELSYHALRVERVQDGGDQMVVWVADRVPTPVRILDHDADGHGLDLRLTEYQGTEGAEP